jgi:hypothetical protein
LPCAASSYRRRRLGQRDPEFIGANRAERTLIGDYELVVFDLPADRAGPAVISWELFGPPRHQELIAHGEAQTFEDAKLAAERAFDKLRASRAPVISITDKKSVLMHIHEQ